MKRTRSKNINSISKGADILKHLAKGLNRVSDLANDLRLGKSTVHRLLKSLEESSLVMQDPATRRYYLGSLILDLASRPTIAHQNLVINSIREMRRLRDLTRETVVLHIRVGLERICLEEVESPEAIKHAAGKGTVLPLYVGAAGKILLSELRDDELQLLFKNMRLDPLGPNTIIQKEVLLKELEKARKAGYATSFGEKTPGGASISVPVRNYTCPVALSILAPETRFSFDMMMGYLDEMKRAAKNISKKLPGRILSG